LVPRLKTPKFHGKNFYDVLTMYIKLENEILLVSICLFGTKLQFCMFWLKNQNKSRRLRNAMKLCRSFLFTSTDVSKNN